MSLPNLEQLRQVIETALAELGHPDAQWTCLKRTIAGQGHPPPQPPEGGVLAVWLTDRGAIELYSEDGDLLTTIDLGPLGTRHGKAA